MKYSLNIELGSPDKNKRQKIYVRVIIDRKIYRISTDVYHVGKTITKQVKTIYEVKKHEIEGRILHAIQNKLPITKELLSGEFVPSASVSVAEYIDILTKRLEGKIAAGRIKHYKVLRNNVEEFKLKSSFAQISSAYLEEFETHLRKQGLKSNTVASKIRILKAVIHRAEKDKILPYGSIEGYKNPPIPQTLPVYLTQNELTLFENMVYSYGENLKKNVGMHFLLACYTGYRISDIFRFNSDLINDNAITIRAKKNGKIVSIPIHSKLAPVIDYIREHPLKISEDKFRKYVKQIAKDAGISKDIKVHSGRHTFAMMLMIKGFTVDEVAEYLGDTSKVAAIYARISHSHLDNKILKAFQ